MSCCVERLMEVLFETFVLKPFNFVINRSALMATLAEIGTMIDEVAASVAAIDSELDGVATMIADLKAGQVSQEQIDALASKMETLKAHSAAVVAETSGLKA